MPQTQTILTLLSMLHEGAENSANRLFRGEPVLGWTIRRVRVALVDGPAVVLCWDDQVSDVERVINACGGPMVRTLGPRQSLPYLDAIAAARRWSDGWRSGPLGSSAFDLGFHPPAIRDVVNNFSADAVLLIDPAAGLVAPELISSIVARLQKHPDLEFTFTQAATGLGAMVLGKPLIDRLAAAGAHPGRLLAYFPDQVSREPTSNDNCVIAPRIVARSLERFTLSSLRQIEKLSLATADLNGQLIGSSAEAVATRINAAKHVDPLPREVVLETTTRRLTKPVFFPSPQASRPDSAEGTDVELSVAFQLIDELSEMDDSRITLAGVGDPLLYPKLLDLLAHAAERRVAVHVETDLLVDDAKLIAALASSSADIISVHFPAATERTYQTIMGVDGYRKVLENLQALISARQLAGRGTPLVIPLFAKCRQNLHEMEHWYDQWLQALGSAVIFSPTTFAGLIPDAAAVDMAPPKRVPCRRLSTRLTVLSDGRYTTCEQDLAGRQAQGSVGGETLGEIWRRNFTVVRSCHADGRWNELPVCATCREWHRP